MSQSSDFPTTTLPSGAIVLAKPDGSPLTYGNKTQASKKGVSLDVSFTVEPTEDGKRFYVVTGWSDISTAIDDNDEPVTVIPATPRTPGYVIPRPPTVSFIGPTGDVKEAQITEAEAEILHQVGHRDVSVGYTPAVEPRRVGYRELHQKFWQAAHSMSLAAQALLGGYSRPYRRGNKSGRRSFLFGSRGSTTINPRNRHNHEHSTDARHTIKI